MDVSGKRTVNILNQQKFKVQLAKTFSDKIYNATTGIYLASYSDSKPAKVGAFAELGKKGTTTSVHLSQALQFIRTLSFTFSSEFFNDGKHFLHCDCKYSFIKPVHGHNVICKKLGLGYRHARGHNVYLSMTEVEKFYSNTFDLLAKAKLWSSPDKATTLELSIRAAYSIDCPFMGRSSFGVGLKLAHHF